MGSLQQTFPICVACFASGVYWKDEQELRSAVEAAARALREQGGGGGADAVVSLIRSEADAAAFAEGSPRACLFVPMSGGVQPWMTRAAEGCGHIGLANLYLPGSLADDWSDELLDRNAHPAATDFYALCRRRGWRVRWLRSLKDIGAFIAGWQGSQRLRRAALVQVGQTEPWVINSCRDPERFRESLGVKVVPVTMDEFYARVRATSAGDAESIAESWWSGASSTATLARLDVLDASKVVLALRRLLEEHDADGLSMACFAMIGELDTTSCLALSTLNDGIAGIGGCEGDLDAAATMLLLKAVGASTVWIGNPIIGEGDSIHLVHCTAPRCACGKDLPYRLMRHHESGRGVSPEVELPANERVTLARIGDDVKRLAVHGGVSSRTGKLRACHTQLRVTLDDPAGFLDHLLGTHQVLTFGDHCAALAHAGRFLGLDLATDAVSR